MGTVPVVARPSTVLTQPILDLLRRSSRPTGIPEDTRARMESALHADFADVRVHTDSAAAAAIGARAYTVGSDIHFARAFDPGTAAGQAVLGHELVHVIQQREGRVTATACVRGIAVNSDPALESEAARLGAQAARHTPGRYATLHTAHHPPVSRVPAPVAQRVKRLKAGDAVKIVLYDEEEAPIVTGTIEPAKDIGEEAYLVKIAGSDNDALVDQTFVFPAEQDEAAIREQLRPLMNAHAINRKVDDDARLKAFNDKTQGGEHSAPRKLLELRASVPAGAMGRDAASVVADAVKSAAELLTLHPFTNANGRTALYLIYKDALAAGFEITLNALQLHGIVLGENQPAKVEKDSAKVTRNLLPSVNQVIRGPNDHELDQRFLAERLKELKSLEADRKERVQLEEKAQREERQRRQEREHEREQQKRKDNRIVQKSDYDKVVSKLSQDDKEAIGKLWAEGYLREEVDYEPFVVFALAKANLLGWNKLRTLLGEAEDNVLAEFMDLFEFTERDESLVPDSDDDSDSD